MKKMTRLYSDDEIIKTTINKREENYFLVTEFDLKDIKSTGFIGNIFISLGSIMLGAFFSNLIYFIPLSNNQGSNQYIVLKVLNIVFIIAAVIFICFAAFYYIKNFKTIKKIVKTNEVNIIPDNDNELKIVKASYGANDKFVDLKNELNNLIIDNKLEYTGDYNVLKKDPIFGTPKTLTLEYVYQGRIYDKIYNENDDIKIPENN